MEAESLFERLRECVSGECLGLECRDAPFSAKRVASLGDMVSGTMSDLPAGEGRKPDLALLSAGLDALKPDLACNMAPSQSQSHSCVMHAPTRLPNPSALFKMRMCAYDSKLMSSMPAVLLVTCRKPCASTEVCSAAYIPWGI